MHRQADLLQARGDAARLLIRRVDEARLGRVGRVERRLPRHRDHVREDGERERVVVTHRRRERVYGVVLGTVFTRRRALRRDLVHFGRHV